MDLRNLIDCIDAVSISNNATITQLKHEEDDALYQVWRIDTEYAGYILKEAKGNEKEIYDTFLGELKGSAPALYQSVTMDGKNYLLLEYVEGENLPDLKQIVCAIVLGIESAYHAEHQPEITEYQLLSRLLVTVSRSF